MESHHDCDTNQMLSVFKELGKRDHSRFDCVVCCVLSHGVEGSVYGVDGSTVKISDLTDLFNGLNCPSLVGKPKLFFIQACQGNNEQQAVFIESDSSAYSFHWTDAIKAKQGIPNSADFLLGMATVPFHVSFRERTNGTWFIQSLCQNLVQMVPRLVNQNIKYNKIYLFFLNEEECFFTKMLYIISPCVLFFLGSLISCQS